MNKFFVFFLFFTIYFDFTASSQQISGKSALFSYTYGLNKYFSTEEFKKIPPLLVMNYRKNILADIGKKQTLFVVRGEFETDYDYTLRKDRMAFFKYDVLRKYRKEALYTGLLRNLIKVARRTRDNYLYILENMLAKK